MTNAICYRKLNSFLSKEIEWTQGLWVDVKYNRLNRTNPLRLRCHVKNHCTVTTCDPLSHLTHDTYANHVITSLTSSTKSTKIKQRSSRKALGYLVVADALRDNCTEVQFDVFIVFINLTEVSRLKITWNKVLKSGISVINSSSSRITQNRWVMDHKE